MILGADGAFSGTVGGGVAEVMAENHDSIAHNAADEIELKYILCRRDRPGSPFSPKIIHDFETILNDPEIKIVAECIGGMGEAYDYTKRLLLAGKSVVTANKELVANKGHELLEIAKANNLNYLFNFLSKDAKAVVAAQAMKNKEEIVRDKIFSGLVEGRFSKQLKDICLLDQVYVKAEDGKQSVAKYLEQVSKETGSNISVKRFVRFETGEGLEKKNEDFAAEVAAQL